MEPPWLAPTASEFITSTTLTGASYIILNYSFQFRYAAAESPYFIIAFTSSPTLATFCIPQA